jgi:hypothetical protein
MAAKGGSRYGYHQGMNLWIPRRHGWILSGGVILLLAGPLFFFWQTGRAEPWDAAHLRVQFQSMRYERAGLVFTYRLQNRTRRDARLNANNTRILIRQAAGQPPAGYPGIHWPLEIPAQSARDIEVRLELPLPHAPRDAEQTARVLAHHLPSAPDLDSLLPPLPMTRPPVEGPAPAAPDPDALVAASLASLDGFELRNDALGLRILLPRAW